MSRAMRFVPGLVALVLVALVCGAAVAQTAALKVTVSPEKNPSNNLTGNYVASVSVDNAPTAREVVARINFPTAYGVDTAVNDIRIKAVTAGADVYSLTTTTPATPVVFAEATTADGVNGIWVVALLVETEKTPKKVCDITFTARGKPTTSPLTFETGSVAVKNAALATLISAGTFANNTPVPLFGDLNWDSKVNALDFAAFGQAWREYNASKTDLPIADLNPRANTAITDPAQMLTDGAKANKKVDALDFADFGTAWRNYNKTLTSSAKTTEAPKEGSH